MRVTTDNIILVILLYLFYKGWRRGFLKTLLGPISLMAGCIMGFVYYQKTANMALSLVISILSPFLINMLASVLLRLWHKTVNADEPLSLLSRLCGSGISISWGGSYAAITLILIGVSPPLPFKWFDHIRQDVTTSKSYALIDHWLEDKIPATLDIKKITDVLSDQNKLEEFRSSQEFQDVMTDGRLEDIFADHEVAELIRDKDYVKLLTNPKMRVIFQDKDLINKIMALNKKVVESASDIPADKDTPKKKTNRTLPSRN
jgi:uncharacterized membrane protein